MISLLPSIDLDISMKKRILGSLTPGVRLISRTVVLRRIYCLRAGGLLQGRIQYSCASAIIVQPTAIGVDKDVCLGMLVVLGTAEELPEAVCIVYTVHCIHVQLIKLNSLCSVQLVVKNILSQEGAPTISGGHLRGKLYVSTSSKQRFSRKCTG